MSGVADPGFEHEVDFLIVGSGAGAMTAGIVAADAGGRVLPIEKAARYGGSSAMSGGGLWVPNHHLMEEAGQRDTPEEALAYLRGTVGDVVPEERMRAYLENAPAMAKYLSEKTRVRFHPVPDYADYYPHVPGAKEGARCLEADAHHARELGSREFLRMRETAVQERLLGRGASPWATPWWGGRRDPEPARVPDLRRRLPEEVPLRPPPARRPAARLGGPEVAPPGLREEGRARPWAPPPPSATWPRATPWASRTPEGSTARRRGRRGQRPPSSWSSTARTLRASSLRL